MKAPSSSEHTSTMKELRATRQARRRRISGVVPRVSPKNTSADPGGLTTGKIAASTRRNALKAEFIQIRSYGVEMPKPYSSNASSKATGCTALRSIRAGIITGNIRCPRFDPGHYKFGDRSANPSRLPVALQHVSDGIVR